MRRLPRSTPVLAATLAAAALTLPALPARATGMQGHIYMAMCAAEQTTDERLRAVFDGHPIHLANGAFLVDSGYTMDDHDQGEIPHWEGFIEAYLQILREKHAAPYDSPEARQHVATLMGMAAHGITDSTFDSLFFARAEEFDAADMNAFDLSMDVFLVHDMPRYFIPDFAYDADTLSEAFTRVKHPIPVGDVNEAISTARTGIAALTTFLYVGADDYGKTYPWARAHVLDPRTPGAYAFGASVVKGYYRELLRRLDGDTSADGMVIGTYPSADYPMATLDATRADGKVVVFFGHGLDRDSITDSSVTILGPGGAVVPALVEVFRGDEWPNVLTARAQQSWEPGATYQVIVSNALQTLNGTSPKDDLTFSFTTCTTVDQNGNCPVPDGPGPTSACPVTEAMYAKRPEEGSGGAGGSGGVGGGTGGAGGPAKDPGGESGGCGVADGGGGVTGGALLALALGAALRGRRRGRALNV